MKRKTSIFGTLIIGAICLFSCNTGTPQNHVYVAPAQQYPQQQYQQQPQNVTVQPAANIPGGFNVQAFAGLLQQTSDPNALTQAINAQNNSINHLDLDGDGNVDYLRVDQTGDNTLVVVDETATQKLNICTLTVNNANNSYSVVGTPDYCGSSYSYSSPTGLTLAQYAFLSWWFAPVHYHHYYHPAYWGYHQHYYGGYRPYRGSGLYTSRDATTYRTRIVTKTQQAQPQQQRQQAQPQRNIPTVSNATASQKQFNAGEGNRFKANNGGSNNVFKSAPAPAPKASSGGSSHSFGGSRSSFGGGRRR